MVSAGTGRRGAPSLRDVARQAGVSVATASRALSSDYPVAEATRDRVLQAVAELGYVITSRPARTVEEARPRSVALVLDDVVSPLRAHVSAGVSEAAEEFGRVSLIYTTGGQLWREEQAIEHVLTQDDVDAVIMVGGVELTPAYRLRMERCATQLHAHGSQLVLCGRPPLSEGIPALTVEYDNEGGAFAVTSHLLSMGHQRVLTTTGPAASTTTLGRLAGYRRAHEEFGLPVDPELVIASRADRAGAHSSCRRAVAEGLDFTAVFAQNDVMASGALAALREAGLRVPEDVSLVGFDNLPVAQELSPPLTTVYMPHEEMGKMAVRLAMQRPVHGSGREHVRLGTHIVIRRSVAPPSRSRERPSGWHAAHRP